MKSEVRSVLFLISTFILFLCVSCRHTTPLKDRMYIQSFGADGQFIVTVNANLLDVEKFVSEEGIDFDSNVQYVTDRMSRLSIVLFDKSGEYSSYPIDYSVMDFNGAIEGNYSKFLLNTALRISGALTESKVESGLKIYTEMQSGLQITVPKNGIVLFSSSNVESNYNAVFGSSEAVISNGISDENAQKLASCAIGIYVSNPKTMLDVGLDIPQSSLDNIEYILMMINEDSMSVDFKLKSESLSRSFSIIVRASYVGDLRREGLPVDIETLKNQFIQEFDMVYIRDLALTQEQHDAIKAVAVQLLDILNY